MRRFLIVVALSVMMAVGVLNSAMAGTVKFDDDPSFNGIVPTLIAKETIKSSGGTAADYSTGVWFQLSGFEPVLGGDTITLTVPNAKFRANGAMEFCLLTDDDGVYDAVNTRVLAVATGEWKQQSTVVFTYNNSIGDLNGKKLALGYATGGVPSADTVFSVGLDVNADQATIVGYIQMNLDQLTSSGKVQVITGSKGAVYASLVKQFDGVTQYIGGTYTGFDTVDVNQARKYFNWAPGADVSPSMAFQLGTTKPTPGYEATAKIVDKVSFHIRTNVWPGIKPTPAAKAITIKTDDNKTLSGKAIFGDDNKTFTLEITNDDNQTAIINAKYFTVGIRVTGQQALQVRNFSVAMQINFSSPYNLNDVAFGPVVLGEWKLNAYQGIVPYVSMQTKDFGSTILLNNTSGKSADVFFDVVSTDDPTLDVSMYQNKSVPKKGSIPSQGSLTILPEDRKSVV